MPPAPPGITEYHVVVHYSPSEFQQRGVSFRIYLFCAKSEVCQDLGYWSVRVGYKLYLLSDVP